MGHQLLAVGGVGLTIIALIAAGVAAMRTADLNGVRAAGDDAKKWAESLKAERDDLKAKLTEERLQHEITKRDLVAIGRVATGEAHWVSIEDQIAHLRADILAALERIERKGKP